MKQPSPKVRGIEWYFSRVNGRVAVSSRKTALDRSSSALNQKNNVEARHRISWRGHNLFLTTLFVATFLFSGSIVQAASLLSKEKASSSALVSREASRTAAPTKAPVKKKGGLPARDPELEKLATKAKSAEGVISGVSRHGVAVEYGSDPKEGGLEIWFNFVEKMKLSGFDNLADLKEGDTVSVAYKEAPDHRRLIDEIRLVAKKAVEPDPLAISAALEPGAVQ